MRFLRIVLLVALVAAFQATTVAASRDAFTGAWTATDTDGSTLKAQISAPAASGVRRVTFIDHFASACGSPATAIGSGTVTGATLAATLNVRCGGAPFASDAPFTFDLVGDTLVSGGIVFTRVGGG